MTETSVIVEGLSVFAAMGPGRFGLDHVVRRVQEKRRREPVLATS